MIHISPLRCTFKLPPAKSLIRRRR